MIDLSITKDPEWIAERQKKWDVIKEYKCDGLSKKEREKLYQYFMFGAPPKKITDFYFTDYFTLFPLQTIEAHRFIAAKYFVPAEWTEREWGSFIDSVLLTESKEVGKQEKLLHFRHYMGRFYEAGRNFPFLIGQEDQFRSFDVDPRMLFRKLNNQLNSWIYDTEYKSDQSIAPYLLDYFFSLIDYQLPEAMSRKIPADPTEEKNDEIRYRVRDVILACERMRTLMRLVYTRFHFPAYFSVQDEKYEVICELFNRFESLGESIFSRELMDHWHWVKRRTKLYELTFKIPDGMEDDVRQIEYDLYANSEYIINDLEKIDDIDIQKAIQLHSEYRFDEHYFVELARDAKCDSPDLIVFACTDKAVIDVLSEFLITCGVSKLSCTEILG